MERTINTKFYQFEQNNSGGYLVQSDEHGVCETVIIEAQNESEAQHRLDQIGNKVAGFNSYCGCCGARWNGATNDGDDTPMHYGKPLDEVEVDFIRTHSFVHYYDGTFKEFKYKQPATNHE